MSLLLDWALHYATRGWPVLPLHGAHDVGMCTCGQKDCTSPAKHPRTRNGLKDASTDENTIRSWWGRWPEANIGLRTGIEFDVLDVDGDAGFASVDKIEADYGPADAGPQSFTGGGGLHRLYLPTGIGNKAGLLDHVDWRGQNGYIVAPPSRHATGNLYEWDTTAGVDTHLSEVSGWLRDLLFPPQHALVPVSAAARSAAAGGTPYARRAFDAELGELARARQGTRNHTLNDCAFNLYQLVYGGELDDHEVTSAISRVAAGIGLGDREIAATLTSARTAAAKHPRSAPALTVITRPAAPAAPRLNRSPGPAAAPAQADIVPDPDEEPGSDVDLTSWEPVDIADVIAGGCVIPPPTLYRRGDGICLLYPGKIHAFNGEPESGKSWAAQHAAAQTLTAGLEVCYLDFEDSPESVVGRLLSLGASPETLTGRLTYVSPERPLTPEAGAVLRDRFRRHRPDLVVIDGMTEAMSIFGLNPLDNQDSATFFRLLPRRLARLGAAVVIIDHVVKDTEGRGRWAIGAQHKMAALTGAAFTVDVVKPFGRNRAGFSKITVTKDRPGYIRQHAVGAVIAELHLSSSDETVQVELRAPLESDGGFRPTAIMEEISKRLAGRSAVTGPELQALVQRRKDWMLAARRLLVDEGYVSEHKSGNSIFYGFIKPYSADSDPHMRREEGVEDATEPF